jgi:hypothetical protein
MKPMVAMYRFAPDNEPEPVMILAFHSDNGTTWYLAVGADGETLIDTVAKFQVVDGNIMSRLRLWEGGS